MKTMKFKDDLPIRVQDSIVKRYLALGYSFCPKKEWKTTVRDKKDKRTDKSDSNTGE